MTKSATINIIKGDTATFTLTFKDADGVAINITGSEVFFTVKENKEDTDAEALITKDVISHTDPVNGITQIDLSSAQTDIVEGVYLYDIQIKYASGDIHSITYGDFRVVSDITRRTS
jgi:hypothetical protein